MVISSFNLGKYPAVVLLLLISVSPALGQAAPRDISGLWYQAPTPAWTYQGQNNLEGSDLLPVSGVALTGGTFAFQADLILEKSARQVLDFKNTSILGRFTHYIFDARNRLVLTLEGGIQNRSRTTYFLRHGHEIELAAGRYRLITILSSPFFLAQPEPYLDSHANYEHSIRQGNALTLIGLGIFLGLGIYYATLMLSRRRMAEGMYALFMLGNILFFGCALLVIPEFLGVHWIYFCSVPILFSNCAYIGFVMALLEIRHDNHPHLYRAGLLLLAVLGLFIVVSALRPNWSLELARYGVGLFLLYGLTAGIMLARLGNISARLYLVAIGVFFVLGAVAITKTQLAGVYTLYIEHVGLFAVAIEAILLALVLSYQFARLQHEKELALQRLDHSNRLAYSDSLTGLSNRFALDLDLDRLPSAGSLTFIDLDRLKYYNDRFGHGRGDELLRSFSQRLASLLASKAKVYRIGGDEFAVACPSGEVRWVEERLAETIEGLNASGFEFAGASAGSAYSHECSSSSELKHLADTRMYERKRERKIA